MDSDSDSKPAQQTPAQQTIVDKRVALAQAVGAYCIWGFLPVFFYAVSHISPLEVVSHRIVWSLLLLLPILWFRKRLGELWSALRSRKMILPMVATAALIAVNWLTYIWAVGNGHITAASLGYYLNPLLNVVLGFFLLNERLSRWQWGAVALAAAGVAVLAVGDPSTLWISMVVALTFGGYGMIRKVAPIGPMIGLTCETILLFPIAIGFLLWQMALGQMIFLNLDVRSDLLLIASGVVTATPLLLFASATRKMRLVTIGFIQYIGPTLQFLLAVLVYGETLTLPRVVTFLFIWAGLALYSYEAWRIARKARRGEAQAM